MATYRIWGRYQGKKRELIDTATNPKSALYLKKEYQLAFGKDWELTIVPNPLLKLVEVRGELNDSFNLHIQGTKSFK